MLRRLPIIYCRITARNIFSGLRNYGKKSSSNAISVPSNPSQLQQNLKGPNAFNKRPPKSEEGGENETTFYQTYPLDTSFIDELYWLSEGLLKCAESSEGQSPAAPLIRIQHQSIASSVLQKGLAKMLAKRLDARFLEISSKMLQSVELSRISDAVIDDNSDEKNKDVSSMALSAILAIQKQELSSGIYTISPSNKNARKKRSSDSSAPSDFVLFTIPSLNHILEELILKFKEPNTILVYLPDYDEVAATARDRRMLSDFVDSFNKLHRPVLFVAPGYSGFASGETANTEGSATAALNVDFKMTPTGTQQSNSQTNNESFNRYGPLWQPLPSSVAIQDRALLVAIPKPSDPRRALLLRQSLNSDEERLIHEYNLVGLTEMLDEMSLEHNLDPTVVSIKELRKRARTRNDLARIALAAKGISNDDIITEQHVRRALKSQSKFLPSHTEDSLSARFAHLLAIDQLNNYERQLLRSCVTTPDMLQTRYDDVAGAEDVKSTLDDLISKPIRHPHLFSRGILKASRSGILLFGPPGTGKTMLARAVATESGATFIAIGPADLNSKWVGEGEKFARAVFTLARKLAPSVIFLDEIDALLESRDTASSRSSKVDILSELMSQWDGMWDMDNSHLVVMGATNRPYALDAACLRRLPRRLLVDLPDHEGRVGILKLLLREDKLTDSVDLRSLSSKAESFSGSDLKHLCQAAALIAANEQSELDGVEGLVLEGRHFDQALERVSSSVSHSSPALIKLRRWNTMYGLSSSGKRKFNTVGFE